MSLLNEKILDLTRELQDAHGDDAVFEIFGRLWDFLLDDEIRQDSVSYQSVLSLLTDIESALTDIMNKHYIRSILYIFKGDKAGYLSETEEYIQLFIEEHGEFTYEQAYTDIIEVLELLANVDEYASYIKKLSNILDKHAPQSAFCAYLKYIDYLTKASANENTELKLFGQILGIDPDWYVAHIHMGDIYYNQKKWEEAIKSYEAGVAGGDLWKTDDVFFSVAYAYSKTKQYAESIENYQKCLAITPDYQYANNNLVNTKYYRDLLAKMNISTELEQTTAYENAGTIAISDEKSGLQLFPHQQDAICDMSSKILNKDKYAGLLVLPTGGGKTLTATYWLMGNISTR